MDRRTLLAVPPALLLAGCAAATSGDAGRWRRLAEAAPFPGSYGFPVHVTPDGRFVALHPRGCWQSRDGAAWERAPLPVEGLNHSYLPIIQHRGEAWSLGTVRGDYTGFAIAPVIRRTDAYRAWTIIGTAPGLPPVVFPAVASFRGQLWLIGGFDGQRETTAIWSSADGLHWNRVVENAPWVPGGRGRTAVFRDRLWLIGNGPIDGAVQSEVWSTADGVAWRREAPRIADPQPYGYTPCVFDDRLWLVGANRAGGFGSGMLVSRDGRAWQPVEAPWSPRGLPAVWTDGRRMFLTGGKYSYPANGEPRFVYSNDVWAMS